jgi:hypothetical protein
MGRNEKPYIISQQNEPTKAHLPPVFVLRHAFLTQSIAKSVCTHRVQLAAVSTPSCAAVAQLKVAIGELDKEDNKVLFFDIWSCSP